MLDAIEPRYNRVWRCIPTVYLDGTVELKVYNTLKEFSGNWLSPNQLRILMVLQTGHCHISGHLFKLGLVDNHRCDRCIQAIETTSHSLCKCATFTTLRFRHLSQHFMLWGHHCQQDTALCSRHRATECVRKQTAQKTDNGWSGQVTARPTLKHSILFYSIIVVIDSY